MTYGRSVTNETEPFLARAVRIAAGVLVVVVVAQVIAGIVYRADSDFEGGWRETFGGLGQPLSIDTGLALLLAAVGFAWLNSQRPASPYDVRALLVVAAYILVISLGTFFSIITYNYDDFAQSQSDQFRYKVISSLRGPVSTAVLAAATIAIAWRGPRDRAVADSGSGEALEK